MTKQANKVFVMPRTIIMKPSKDDIAAGIHNSPTKCMYAMFLRRLFPKASFIAVNPNGITITLNGQYYHFRISKKTVAKMAEFDKGIEIDPAKAVTEVELIEHHLATYTSTPEAREYHRLKAARRRADPDYVRPDGLTLRAIVARSMKVELRTHP